MDPERTRCTASACQHQETCGLRGVGLHGYGLPSHLAHPRVPDHQSTDAPSQPSLSLDRKTPESTLALLLFWCRAAVMVQVTEKSPCLKNSRSWGHVQSRVWVQPGHHATRGGVWEMRWTGSCWGGSLWKLPLWADERTPRRSVSPKQAARLRRVSHGTAGN